MAVFSIAALAAEITNDPLAIGYKTGSVWNGDQEIADLLNAKNYTVNHKKVDTGDIRGVTTFDAFDGLTAAEEAWFSWLTQNGEIPVNTDTLKNLAGIGGTSKWGVADRATMEPRMQALMQFTGSRAEVLWGEGATISASQVGQAANV